MNNRLKEFGAQTVCGDDCTIKRVGDLAMTLPKSGQAYGAIAPCCHDEPPHCIGAVVVNDQLIKFVVEFANLVPIIPCGPKSDRYPILTYLVDSWRYNK